MTIYDDLIAAGLPVLSANETGEVVGVPGVPMTASQIQAMNDIILQHLNPTAYDIAVRVRDRLNAAKATAKAIPAWASWTQAQFLTWCDNNLMTDVAIDGTNLSTALKGNLKANNAAIRSVGKLLIAIRDYIWSDLPE